MDEDQNAKVDGKYHVGNDKVDNFLIRLINIHHHHFNQPSIRHSRHHSVYTHTVSHWRPCPVRLNRNNNLRFEVPLDEILTKRVARCRTRLNFDQNADTVATLRVQHRILVVIGALICILVWWLAQFVDDWVFVLYVTSVVVADALDTMIRFYLMKPLHSLEGLLMAAYFFLHYFSFWKGRLDTLDINTKGYRLDQRFIGGTVELSVYFIQRIVVSS